MVRLINHRSSGFQMFFKIGALKNLVIFTGENLCWSLFNKVTGLFPAFRVNKKKYSERYSYSAPMREEDLQLC